MKFVAANNVKFTEKHVMSTEKHALVKGKKNIHLFVFGFYGISTFVGYLIPNLFLYE